MKVLLPKLLFFLFLSTAISNIAFSQENFPITLFGDAFTEVALGIKDPFNEDTEVPRKAIHRGRTAVLLHGTAGDRYTAKVDFSLLGSLNYSGASGAPESSVAPPTIDVQKLYVSVFTEPADFFAGRMIVNYGRGTVLSPADLFSGIDAGSSSLNKTGVDAARVLIPLGALCGVEFVSTIAENFENAQAGMRGYGNVKGWDFALAAFYKGQEKEENPNLAVFSFDTKGDLIVGLSAEAVAFLDLQKPKDVRAQTMIGFDYSFSNAVFFDVEYQWNGTSGAQGVFKSAHTIFASTAWQPNELFSANFWVIKALPAKDFATNFSLSYRVVQNAMLSGFVSYSRGNMQNPGSVTDASGATRLAKVGARIHVLF